MIIFLIDGCVTILTCHFDCVLLLEIYVDCVFGHEIAGITRMHLLRYHYNAKYIEY